MVLDPSPPPLSITPKELCTEKIPEKSNIKRALKIKIVFNTLCCGC